VDKLTITEKIKTRLSVPYILEESGVAKQTKQQEAEARK
jgi:hypothetical protein